MAKVTISGLRLKGLSVSELDTEGRRKLSGTYAVLTDAGKVLATQSFNTYGGLDVVWSPGTQSLIDKTLDAVQKDLETLAGFSDEA